MRQDNASLRKRLLEIEARVRRLAREPPHEDAVVSQYERRPTTVGRTAGVEATPSWSPMDAQRAAPTAAPRGLPVVKLERETSADRREGRVSSAPRTGSDGDSARARESVSLSTVPHTGLTGDLTSEVGTADPYAASASGQQLSPQGDNVPADWVVASNERGTGDALDETIDAGGDAPRRTFKLVGSHLVEATKTKRPNSSSRSTAKNKKKKKKRTTRSSGGPETAYKRARALYTSGDVVAAEQAFEAFARTYPRHEHADNALYWKGEAAYDQAHFSDALAAFTEVIERYGGGNKASDALLKIGLCYGKVGDRANAQDVLEQLVLAYPNARASAIAREKLEEMSGAKP